MPNLCCCCDALLRRALRDDDPEPVVRRKVLIVPFASAVLCGAGGIVASIAHKKMSEPERSLDAYLAGNIGAATTAAVVLVVVLITRRLSLWGWEAAASAWAICVLFIDWENAALGETRAWPLMMLVMDSMLFVRGRPAITNTLLSCTLLWLVVTASEDAMRWGLYDDHAVTANLDFKIRNCDCAIPPCAGGPMNGASRLFMYTLIYVTDYLWTRGFAMSMYRERAAVDSSVAAVGRIAGSLVDYDLDAAAGALDEVGEELPPELRRLCQQLLDNLSRYRPFLPQSCVPAHYKLDNGAGDGAPSGGSGSDCSGSFGRRATVPTMLIPQGPTGADLSPVNNMASLSDGSGAHRKVGFLSPRRSPKKSVRERSPLGRAAMKLSIKSLDDDDPDVLSTSSDRPSILSILTPRSPSKRGPPPLQMKMSSRSFGRSSGRDALHLQVATLVVGNVLGYLRMVREEMPAHVSAFHSRLLAQMERSTATAGALTDAVCGDRFFASVNGARPATGHRARGVGLAFALSLCDTADAAAGASPRGATAGLRVSAAASSGQLLCGVIGTESLKHFSLIGAAAAWSRAQERLAAAWGCAVLVNGAARDDASTAYLFRLRGGAALRKAGHDGLRAQQLWEVRGPRAQDEQGDEWMYLIEKQDATDPWAPCNAALGALLAGDFAATALLAASARKAAASAPPLPAAEMVALLAAIEAAAAARPADPHSVLVEAQLVPPPPGAAPGPAAAAAGGGATPTKTPTSEAPRDRLVQSTGAPPCLEAPHKLLEKSFSRSQLLHPRRPAARDRSATTLGSSLRSRSATVAAGPRKAPAAPPTTPG